MENESKGSSEDVFGNEGTVTLNGLLLLEAHPSRKWNARQAHVEAAV